MTDARVPAYLGRLLTPDRHAVGTCFQVAPNYLVSALHVLQQLDASNPEARVLVDELTTDSEPAEAHVLRIDEEHDLAVFHIDQPFRSSIEGFTASDDCLSHTKVCVQGVAELYDVDGRTYRYTTALGNWIGAALLNNQIKLGQLSSKNVFEGMSGAPVRLVSAGQTGEAVVGVVSGRYTSGSDGWGRDTVWVARTEDLRRLLDGFAFVPELVKDPRAPGVDAWRDQVPSPRQLPPEPPQFIGRMPDDRKTLRRESLLRREDHAYNTGAAGDHAEGAHLYAGIVPDYIRVIGPDSPETSRVRRLLSYHTGMAGDAATARRLFAELVPHCTRLFGPDHSETLLSRQGLAAWTGEAGDPAKAARMYTELVSDCVRVLGPDNPLTLECRWHLGLYTGQAGNAAEAARMLAELVPEHVHILSPGNDTETTKVHRLLGYYTGMAGHADEAIRIFAKLVPDCTRAFGPDHRETLLSRQGVAGWTGEAGNPAEATRRYTELVPDCVRVLGSDNPVTLECRRHLALYTERAGDAAKALRLYTELLPDCARVLGPDHPETLLCHQALARLA